MSIKELQKNHATCFELERGTCLQTLSWYRYRFTHFFVTVADMNEIRNLIQILNEKLKIAQLAIKSRLCEDNNEEHFVLLSLTETEAAK